MTFSEFDNEPRFKNLARRRENFRDMCLHALAFAKEHGHCVIIETGSAWHKENWEGQGQSTLVWDWLLNTMKAYSLSAISIDITPSSVESAKEQTTKVDFICSDSVKALNSFSAHVLKECGLLYLDSYDWSEERNLESAFHHVMELTAVWRLLPEGCMVVVDDRHGEERGKHWLVEAFAKQLNLTPYFKNHQICWVKT